MILGLDISTSITGFAIVDKSGKLLYTGHIDTRKEKNIFDKVDHQLKQWQSYKDLMEWLVG